MGAGDGRWPVVNCRSRAGPPRPEAGVAVHHCPTVVHAPRLRFAARTSRPPLSKDQLEASGAETTCGGVYQPSDIVAFRLSKRSKSTSNPVPVNWLGTGTWTAKA